MKTKKILILTVASLMTLSLVACNTNSKKEQINKNDKTEVSQPVEKSKEADDKKNDSNESKKEDKIDVKQEKKIDDTANKKEESVEIKEVKVQNNKIDNEKVKKGEEILKRGYISGGTYIVFVKPTTVESIDTYEYDIEYDNKEGKRVLGSKMYVDVDAETVYYVSDSGELKEIKLD